MKNEVEKNNVNKLAEVKPVPKLPGYTGCTIRMAADYFGVSYNEIQQIIVRNYDFLYKRGLDTVSAQELLSNGYSYVTKCCYERDGSVVYFSTPYSECFVLSDYCILFMAKELESVSDVAKNIMSYMKVDEIPQAEQKVEVLPAVQKIEPMNKKSTSMSVSAKDFQEFISEQFGAVRTLEINGEPWFVGVDVCKALEIANNRNAMSRLDEDEKMTVHPTGTHSGTRGGAQMLNIVNEFGLYALVLGSHKKEAKDFKRWITHEVIPSIRKNGMYVKNTFGIDNLDVSKMMEKLSRLETTLSVISKQYAEVVEKLSRFEVGKLVERQEKPVLSAADRAELIKAIRMMMSVYAGKKCWGKFGYAYAALYTRIRDNMGFDVHERKKAMNSNTMIETIEDGEMPSVVRIANDMMKDINVGVEKVLEPEALAVVKKFTRQAA